MIEYKSIGHQLDVFSPAELEIIRAARHQIEQAEAGLRDQVKQIADEFRMREESLYADRIALEANEAMGHDTLIVSEVTVPTSVLAAAHAATKLAAVQLNTKTPEVRWFTQPDEISLYGRALPMRDIIYLNDQLTPAKAIITAAHEVGHCAGFTEKECREYEHRFLERMFLDAL